MPARRFGVALVVAGATLVGCAPAGLDAQQAKVEARECASLLERHVTGRTPPAAIVLGGETIDLATDPKGFYRQLESERGPDDFPLVGGKAETSQRASFISDLCKAKDASSSKTSTTPSSTTTTTVRSEAPGSGG